MSDQDYATVGGVKVHKSDFGYAPGAEPSKWKFPLHNASHVRDAMARFNQSKDIPPEAKAALKRKIIERAHQYGIDTGNFEKEYASELTVADCRLTNIFSRDLRLSLSQAVNVGGKELYLIPVCVSGTWHKGSRKFSISKDTLGAMARNFAKRKNDMIVIDYEHASEQPEVARGGPVPAAGWIHELQVTGDRPQVAGNGSDTSLAALVEWTPEALQMIKNGQYRFFSPAIDWDAKDKDTGEPQGPTMTSGALTNHPFLEELPAITLSDREQATGGRSQVIGTDTTNQYLDGGHMAEEKKHREVHLKKITDGEHAGHHHVFAGSEDVGCMSEKHLAEHAAKHFSDLLEHDAFKNAARKHFGAPREDEEKETATELGVENFSEARRLIDLGRVTEAADLASKSRQALSEAVKDGKIDNRKAEQLARANRITFADYIAAQEAERVIDAAVRAGKILPRERSFFFRDALERPEEFTELVKTMPARVNLSTVGLASTEAASVDDEISTETRRLMSERKIGYSAALKEVLRANPQLAQNYRKEHSRQMGEAAN